MFIIGLTGNFGTGKSTVAGILSELGAELVDADKLGHQLLSRNPQVKKELLDVFGRGILDDKGKIDRRSLGKLAFKSRQKTLQLNRIMKPRIRERIIKKINRYRGRGVSVLVVEGALLDKKDWKNIIDEVWVTAAPQDTIVERLRTYRGYDEKEVLSRLQRQLSPAQMLNQGDLIINTDCSLGELRQKVNRLWSEVSGRMTASGNSSE